MGKFFTCFPRFMMVFVFFFLLSLVNFGLYLRNGFMIDDYGLVIDQAFVESPKVENFYQHFIPDYKIKKHIENSPAAIYYRPINHLIPFLQFLVFDTDPLGYHFTNLLLFVLACSCFYVLLFELSGDYRLSFLAATLFCLHPINGLMVNYITASVFSAQLIFLSLGVWAYIRWEKNILFLFIALVLFALALLCHETSLMFPAYLFFVTWHKKRDLWQSLKKAFPFISFALCYLVLRFYFASIQKGLLAKIGIFSNLSWINYIATFAKVILWYFKKLILMQGIVLMWSTPLVDNFLWAWLSGAVLMGAIVIFFLSRWKADIKAVFIYWFLLGFFPVMLGCMIFPRLGMIIEPHWLFFASFGFFALIAVGLLQIADRISPRLQVFGFAALCVLLVTASWNNNTLWKDELTYTRHWAKEVPTRKDIRFYVAEALLRDNNLQEAKKWFIQSLTSQFIDWQIYNNLGEIALNERNDEQALAYFQTALAIFPQSATVHNNLGFCYMRKNDLDKAEAYFRQANLLNPYQLEPLLNLGLVSERQGHWEKALECYDRAYILRPKDERVLYSLLWVSLYGYSQPQNISHVEDFLQQIKSEHFLNKLGGLLASKGYSVAALKYFSKAIMLYPQSLNAYIQAGKVFANAGQFRAAADIWEQGLKVKPGDETLLGLLKELSSLDVKVKP